MDFSVLIFWWYIIEFELCMNLSEDYVDWAVNKTPVILSIPMMMTTAVILSKIYTFEHFQHLYSFKMTSYGIVWCTTCFCSCALRKKVPLGWIEVILTCKTGVSDYNPNFWPLVVGLDGATDIFTSPRWKVSTRKRCPFPEPVLRMVQQIGQWCALKFFIGEK